MQCLDCPHCGKPLTSITNTCNSWLEYDPEAHGYIRNDPWDSGEYSCDDCNHVLIQSEIQEAIESANE